MLDQNNLSIPYNEESVIIEKIRISYIKNRGNVQEVCNELKYPREYVIKVIKKFRKESKRVVDNFVADRIMEHLMLGYQTRTQYLFETIKNAEKEEKTLRSTCCKDRVRQLNVGDMGMEGIAVWECLGCHKQADVFQYFDDKYVYVKNDCLEKLRKEDEMLCKFLESNGFIGEKTQKEPEQVQPNVTIYDNKRINVEISQEDAQQIDLLNPLNQEAIRLAIETKILEAEIIEDEK